MIFHYTAINPEGNQDQRADIVTAASLDAAIGLLAEERAKRR
jgi:hypothetical protein